MKKGDTKTIELINGWGELYKVKARFLGAGAFAKVYEYENSVYAIVNHGQKHSDYSKEAVANFASGLNVPEIEVLGHTDSAIIYKMPLYQPLTTKNYKAWDNFRMLLKCWNQTSGKVFRSGLDFNYSFLDRVKESALDEEIKESVESIISAGSNYGDNYRIEICKRNLAVDDKGNLILLDILFNADALKRNQNK